ncbi:DUF4192 domain-containing protein [Plantactinospora siamensis]|uniref:DUF4192 domain-containing protein n=1 Tax=Plantactinospora siamensis TaxID=555372 RepID=A0ABV6NSG8_9ACTN
MATCEPPRLMVRSPADLIAAVPYLLGFHPSDSLVVVALRGPRVEFAARVDLPEPPSGPVGAAPADRVSGAGRADPRTRATVGSRADPLDRAASTRHPAPSAGVLGAMAREIVEVVRRQRVDAVTVLGYGPPERVTPAIDAVAAVVRQHDLRVLDLLRVTGDRYWSYLCDNPACCPADGVRFDAHASPVAAAAIFAGQVALPDRNALERQLAPVGGPERVALRAAAERASKRLSTLLMDAAAAAAAAARTAAGPGPVASAERGSAADVRAEPGSAAGMPAERQSAAGAPVRPTPRDERSRAVRAARIRALRSAGAAALRVARARHRAGQRLTDDEVCWLGVLLSRLPVREQAWHRVDSDPDQVALWTDVLRRVPSRLAAPPAALLAYAAWRSGQGALAVIAVERALAVEPRYPMALLLDEALRAGLPPSVMDEEPSDAARTGSGRTGGTRTGRARRR